MNPASLAEYSFLEPTTTIKDIESVCNKALQYKCAAVCVPPMFVKSAKEIVAGNNIKVATVVGFPFGYNAIEAKLAETVLAIVDGADEINLMINLVALKNNDWQWLAKEINTILTIVRKNNRSVSIIIEAGLLTNDELIACCDLYGAAGVDFIQTSTAVNGSVISIDKFTFVRMHLADAIQIKLAGKIDYLSLNKWLEAGVNRITCYDEEMLKLLSSYNHGMVFETTKDNKN